MSPSSVVIRTWSLSWNLEFLLSRHSWDIRHDNFVDEGAEPEPEIGGNVLHGGGQEVAEGRQLLLVVLHGLGQVHQVVEINWIILGLLVVEVQIVCFVWWKRKSQQLMLNIISLDLQTLFDHINQMMNNFILYCLQSGFLGYDCSWE